MNVLGIIAEYNPFHNGHLYHLRQSREKVRADFVVAVISGNFTQRGEPAICDKWVRSRWAAECGIDLVLELPFIYACNSAEYFAKGGVAILNGLGCVTHLSFGSESGDLPLLTELAAFLAEETPQFQQVLKDKLHQGMSYAKGREEAVRLQYGSSYAALMREPNNILAIQYLKQLYQTKSPIKPVTVKRYGPGYFQEEPVENIASASAIRRRLPDGGQEAFLPAGVLATLSQQAQVGETLFFDLMRAKLLSEPASRLQTILSMGEGLENKLKREIRSAKTLDELIGRVKSKRYPETRIRRILYQMLLGLTKTEFASASRSICARVLAFNQNGAALLRRIKKEDCASIPIITNINKDVHKGDPLKQILAYDILAADFYNMAASRDLYQNSDFVVRPYYNFDKLLEKPEG